MSPNRARRPRVLCVDDQVANLQIRKMLLEQSGCIVTAVEDSRSCLQLVAARVRFDVAVLDYHLAGPLDGEQLARLLRASSPKLKLIMLTGDPICPVSAQASVDLVLVKGASNPADLLDAIQRLVPGVDLRPRHHEQC